MHLADRTDPRSPPGPPPNFDGELASALDGLVTRMSSLSHEALNGLRQTTMAARVADQEIMRNGVFGVDTKYISTGPEGAEIPLMVCTPTAADGLTPVIYFIHGGGMVLGDYRGIELPLVLDLAQPLNAAVVSVGYRLAPEHRHPTPVHDCYAGLEWLTGHAHALNIDLTRIIIVGISAGGGLAAATTLLARDRGAPAIAGQMLLSPMLDDRNDSYSARQMAGRGVWDQHANLLGWTALLGEERGLPGVTHYAAPGRARDLSNLPPTFLDVGSAETFRDEVVDFASRIWKAGGSAELHVWPGAFHGFYVLAPRAELSGVAVSAWHSWLARFLRMAPTTVGRDRRGS